MNPDMLFKICNMTALSGWVLLVAAPRWKWTQPIAAVFLPLLLAAVYLYVVVVHFGKAEGGFGSLAAVAQLFQNPNVLLGGWIHYLAFDLFIGSWELRDAQRHGIHHLAVIPCLILTFWFGPIGLLAYFVLRYARRKKLAVE